MNKKWKLAVVAMVVLIAAMACTVDLGSWKFWDKGTATEEPAAVATFTPLPTFTPIPTQALDSSPTFTVVVPTVTPQISSGTPSTTAIGSACLPGVWQINHDSVTNYMYMTMLGVQQYGFSPESSSGKLELRVVNGEITLLAEDFTVGVGVTVGNLENISAFSASINSQAYATYTATDSKVYLNGILYDADAVLTSLSTAFDINFDELLSLAKTLGFARGIPNPITSRTLDYTCTGDTLNIRVNPYAWVVFDRVLNQ